MKLSIKDFFSKGDQIGRKLRIWSHLLKKSLMKNFIFLCRIKIVLKVPSFFCLVNTADTKSPVSLDHSKMTPLPKRFLTSLVIISVSNMSCAILETFWYWGFSVKLILKPYLIMLRIIWLFVIFFQFSAVPLEKLHYRALEKDKAVALKKASGNFDKIITNISIKAIDELNWWLTEIPHARRNICLPDIDITIHTDASKIGWGETDGNNPTDDKLIEEKENHINYLELKAIYLAGTSYRRYWLGKKHIQVNSNNTTVIAYNNNMGGFVSEKMLRISKTSLARLHSRKHMDTSCSHSWKVEHCSRLYVQISQW